MKRLRLFKASVLAFIMGIPMASVAQAQDVGGIVDNSLGLAFSIIDVAGSS